MALNATGYRLSQTLSDWHTFSGELDFSMTNDYLFRALLQVDSDVLKDLVCCLLSLAPESVTSVEVTNPIELGAHLTDKDFLLDAKILLNTTSVLNLEMQVINEQDWPERSLSYLCRIFDSLNRGSLYREAKSAIQIGLLNFTLFPDYPEFYATYYMTNEITHQKYSDKFRLSVLDLSQIALATMADTEHRRDLWARFFKASKWEELQMLAQENPIYDQATDQIRRFLAEERVRDEIFAREDHYRRELARQKDAEDLRKAREDLAAAQSTIAELSDEIAALKRQLASRET